MKWYSNDSQIAWVCNALIEGKSISHADEFHAVNGWRLASIIHNLKKRYKWPIFTSYGESRIAYYRLGIVEPDKLEKPRSFKKWEAAATAPHSEPEPCKNQPSGK